MVGGMTTPDACGSTRPTVDRRRATDESGPSLLHTAMSDLTKSQHDHERYYASTPRELVALLEGHARTVLELATKMSSSTSPEALVSFDRLKRDLWSIGDIAGGNGAWLEAAMESSWE